MKTKKAKTTVRRITFRIITMHPLPVGEQVFIAGNADALGHWAPNGFALSRTEDLVWSGDVMAPADDMIEYKITRGSWDTEEVRQDGSVPDNHVLPSGNDIIEERTVHHWQDQRVAQPHIVGEYRVHEQFESARLRYKRSVIVWLPPSYGSEPDRRYPVLYMHDGEQVFDPNTSTWGQDRQGDELERQLTGDLHIMCDALAEKGIIPNVNFVALEDPQGKHHEASWASHTDNWLLFLFGK